MTKLKATDEYATFATALKKLSMYLIPNYNPRLGSNRSGGKRCPRSWTLPAL